MGTKMAQVDTAMGTMEEAILEDTEGDMAVAAREATECQA